MKTFVNGRTFRKCYPFKTHSQAKELLKFLLQVKQKKNEMEIGQKVKNNFVLCKSLFSRWNCFISLFVLGRLFIKEGPLLKVSILNTIEKCGQSVEKDGFRPTKTTR